MRHRKPNVRRDPRFAAKRRSWLRKNPTCAACGGRTKVEVHHMLPVHWPGGKEQELSEDNYISLCEAPGWHCHRIVGHSGDYKSRNVDVVEDTVRMLAKIQGRPYPPKAA